MKLFRNEARGWSVMTSVMYKSSDTQGGRVAGWGDGGWGILRTPEVKTESETSTEPPTCSPPRPQPSG